ncbi:MAG: hypothetical protein ABRQ25_15525 [Clostridiaceae bacterium]
MISAAEARKLRLSDEEQQLVELESSIKKRLNKKVLFYHGELYDTVASELKQLGYEIEYVLYPRSGGLTTIRW